MKMSFSKIFLTLLWMFCSINFSSADSTKTQSPLAFSSQPGAQNMDINSTQQVLYTVKNKSIEPLTLNAFTLTPQSTLVKEVVTSNCNDLVPAGGSCQITVTLKSGNEVGSVSQNLIISFGERNMQIISNALDFDILKMAPAKLQFVFQPTISDMQTLTKQDVSFIVKSTSKDKLTPINSIVVAPTSDLVTEVLGGTCFQGVPAGKPCSINLRLFSKNMIGSVTQQLVIEYNNNQSTLRSKAFKFFIEAQPEALVFVEQGTPSNMFVNTQQTVSYIVKNRSLNSVKFSNKDITTNPNSHLVSKTFSNNCNGQILAGKSCKITMVMSAGATAGTVVEEVVIPYHTAGFSHIDQLVSDRYSFKVELEGAELNLIHQGTPVDMAPKSKQVIPFFVKNESANNTVTLLNSFATPHSSLVTETITNKCNDVIPPGQSCEIDLEITATVLSGVVSQKLIINYVDNSQSQFSLESKVFSFDILPSREVKFINQCSVPVWFGVSGGAVYSKLSPSNCTTNQTCTTACHSDADCYANTKCIQTGLNQKQCFSTNFDSSTDTFELSTGEQSSIFIPIPSSNVNFQDIIWSGTFAARTGCTASSCETATCTNTGSARGACTPGVGFTPPNTVAEITLLKSGDDTYDISLIGGFNIPTSLQPIGVTEDPFNPYQCGAAGGTITSQGLGACSWDFTSNVTAPPSTAYVYVLDDGVTGCTANSCPSDQACGVTLTNMLDTSAGQTPVRSCGKFLGFWSSNQACSLNASLGAPFHCATNATMAAPFQNAVLRDLYLCDAGIPSCYSGTAQNNACCGCVNWQSQNILVPTSPIVQQCVPPSTPSWANNVLPTIEWLKQACPRAYAYPFDDKSSTFTCANTFQGQNRANYVVTFCSG